MTVDGVTLRAGDDPTKALVGLVPQDLALIDELPALDNILLSVRSMDWAVNCCARAPARRWSGRPHRPRPQPPCNLQRRHEAALNIACALVHDPKVLVLDEPTVGIDPQSRNHISTISKRCGHAAKRCSTPRTT